ncbi:hypothetical protein [Caulobacter endophyticus]|uniref:hypothetical protein n=1 Tax=Caulobacter endophyticus TaxID=2172652 RepID=UPI00240F8028|nr:hypothetical protein [Caulobacter endophyticus]MDG2530853.1 hypothetical protein [Caulobacter endophyticus]
MSRPHLSLWQVFRIPAVVAVLSLFGLVAALLDDGAWDWIGAAALGVSVAVTVWALAARRR